MQRGFNFNPQIESKTAALLINSHLEGDRLAFTELYAGLLPKIHALLCSLNLRISKYG